MKNANTPAMPIEFSGFGQCKPEAHEGLTKREMFAMHIMQGLAKDGAESWLVNSAPSLAVKIADSLLEKLQEQEQTQ